MERSKLQQCGFNNMRNLVITVTKEEHVLSTLPDDKFEKHLNSIHLKKIIVTLLVNILSRCEVILKNLFGFL